MKSASYFLIVSLFISSCSSKSGESEIEDLTVKDQIEAIIDELSSSDSELSYEERLALIEEAQSQLEQMPAEENIEKVKLKSKITSLSDELNSLDWVEVFSVSGAFLKDKPLNLPFWGLKGDSLKIVFKADQKTLSGRIYETKSGRDVKKLVKFDQIDFKFDVFFNSVFNLNLSSSNPIYYDAKIYRKPVDIASKFANHQVKKDSIIHEKPVANSVKAYELITESVYYEPQKFTMKNSFWSGKTPIYAAIEVPEETKYFVYTMIVTGEDNERYNPSGQMLLKEVQKNTTEYKVMGYPIFSTESTSQSLIRDLINTLSTPSREEGQSLDLYFVESENEVKKFLKEQEFKYDLANSVRGTQSRKGIVKRPKSGYSYFIMTPATGDSEMYVWFDAVALYERPFYYELQYSLK